MNDTEEDLKKEKSQLNYITEDMLTGDKIKIKVKNKKVSIEDDLSFFPKFSLILIAINIIVFIIELRFGALDAREQIINAGALYRENILKGEYWRFLSVMFLHGSFEHLLGNMTMLYVMGLILEKSFKYARCIMIYFFSGFLGALLSVVMHPGPSVGASGAIFGLVGANLTYILLNKHRLDSISIRLGTVLLAFAIYSIILGFADPYIDNFAHIGGFLGGIIISLIVHKKNVR
jgi:rhomboid protease GluP